VAAPDPSWCGLRDKSIPLNDASRASRPRGEFVDVEDPTRLAHQSTIDFVPDLALYQHLTVVTLERTTSGTDLVMEIEPLHDDVWTERLRAGRTNELDNPARLIANTKLRGELRSY
jgi:hypothetical protein